MSKAVLTVTADDQSRAYGAANPALTATITGFKNGEILATSGVTGSPSLSTTATTATSPVGSYPGAITGDDRDPRLLELQLHLRGRLPHREQGRPDRHRR